jgi:hypothetical protein
MSAETFQGVPAIRYRYDKRTEKFAISTEKNQQQPFFFPRMSGNWLLEAAKLPGRALAVACIIQLEIAMNKRSTVQLSNKWLTKAGVSADAKRRALKELEKAGLIQIEHRNGAAPLITVCGM